jgi:tetratricopeptide (TPR) repeat protein
MSDALVLSAAPTSLTSAPLALPVLPWRDMRTVPRREIIAHIDRLEQACLANPQSADLRTCLGMAYAVNHDVYKCGDALEAALTIDPDHFWARLKYGELHYRLRALQRAEEETLASLDLAETSLQFALARRQLHEIRGLLHASVRNVAWTKPLTGPAFVLSGMMVLLFAVMLWK